MWAILHQSSKKMLYMFGVTLYKEVYLNAEWMFTKKGESVALHIF